MFIKNILPRLLEVTLNGKKYSFCAGDVKEVSDAEGKFILRLQPLLVEEVKSVKIQGKPQEIKAVKNVAKNKKSRK